MSDSARAIRTFTENYKGGRRTEEMDFQRANDRGLAPEGRQDPDRVATFRCSKCAHEIGRGELEEAGWFQKDGTHKQWKDAYEEHGLDGEKDDGDVDPGDTDDTGSGN